MSASDDVPALLHAALAQHALGRQSEAEALYRLILRGAPDHPQALGMLALIVADGPRQDEAEALLRRHIALVPGAGASLHALGRILAGRNSDEEALERLHHAAHLLPGLAPAHNDLGAALHRAGRMDEALQAFERAIAIDPHYGVAHANRGLVLQEGRRFEAALEAFAAALAFAASDQNELRPAILVQFAQAARKAGRAPAAEALLRAEWTTRPDDGDIAGELALLLEQSGKTDEAQAVRNDLARRTGLRRPGLARPGAPTLLLLGAVGGGHTPTRYLVDDTMWEVLSLTLLSPDQPDAPLGAVDPAALRQADLVFNTLGDVDHDGGQFAAVDRLIKALDRPALNPPAAIARTGRDQAADLFAGIDGLIVPAVRRLAREDLPALALEQPVLVRPAGDHGGDNLSLLREEADKAAFLARTRSASLLVSPFHDYRSLDGHWRKYRLIFVDRQVFPYHLAIGDDWLTHYWRAQMGLSDWKRAEEETFLADWHGVFGPRAATAAEAAARRLDLDYGGMDCALTASGELLLFEANACVLLHLDEPKARFGYKHRHVPPIREAFTRMALRRAGLS